MLIHPLELGDALVGHVVETFMWLVEHVIPKVHKYLSWDGDSQDLGPIIPELSAPASYHMTKTSPSGNLPHATVA